MSWDRISRRIDRLQTLLPAPPECIRASRILQEHPVEEPLRAEFATFLARVDGKTWRDLTDQELEDFEWWIVKVESELGKNEEE